MDFIHNLNQVIQYAEGIFGLLLWITGMLITHKVLKNKKIEDIYKEGVSFASQWSKVRGKASIIPTNEEVKEKAVTYIAARLPKRTKVDIDKIEAVVYEKNTLATEKLCVEEVVAAVAKKKKL